MTEHYATYFLFVFLISFATCTGAKVDARDEKLISTFQVVRFPNDGCVGSNARNGTCYTSQECTNKGGTSAGSCADGFGVCCTFAITTCGSSTSENLTSWTQPATVSSGSCSLDIIPVSDDICSLRLDFTTFAITGPSTISVPQIRRVFGTPVEDYQENGGANMGVAGVAMTTNCHTDQFYTRGPSPSTNPPMICGTNTGEHMYLEADIDRGNKIWFVFADSATTVATITRGVGTLIDRKWDITISMIECSSSTLPPAGCTKYFWAASGSARVRNYNYSTTTAAANVHLGQQHERMCIRRERGKCVGCFGADAVIAFEITQPNEAGAVHVTTPGGCCGYKSTHAATIIVTTADQLFNGYATDEGGQIGWDCIIIPGAFQPTDDNAGEVLAAQTVAALQQSISSNTIAPVPQGPHICGNGGGIGAGAAILSTASGTSDANGLISVNGINTNLSVCTRHVPFTLEWMSDDLEGLGNLLAGDTEYANAATQTINQGFELTFGQLDCA